MARVKNVGGDPDDEDPRPPPRQPIDAKGKAMKKLVMRKRMQIQREQPQVVEVVERAERGGARSGVVIAD